MSFPKSFKMRSVVVGLLAAIIGIATGSAIAYAVGSSGSSGPNQSQVTSTVVYAVNANGETYGSGLDATSPANEPDLIEAYATNGRLGYVKKVDVEGPLPSTPQQAIQQQSASLGTVSNVPVYESDGKTQIGLFEITHNAGDQGN